MVRIALRLCRRLRDDDREGEWTDAIDKRGRDRRHFAIERHAGAAVRDVDRDHVCLESEEWRGIGTKPSGDGPQWQRENLESSAFRRDEDGQMSFVEPRAAAEPESFGNLPSAEVTSGPRQIYPGARKRQLTPMAARVPS